jgi:hypothetical protein
VPFFYDENAVCWWVASGDCIGRIRHFRTALKRLEVSSHDVYKKGSAQRSGGWLSLLARSAALGESLDARNVGFSRRGARDPFAGHGAGERFFAPC